MSIGQHDDRIVLAKIGEPLSHESDVDSNAPVGTATLPTTDPIPARFVLAIGCALGSICLYHRVRVEEVVQARNLAVPDREQVDDVGRIQAARL
jgi:hypothetical protein